MVLDKDGVYQEYIGTITSYSNIHYGCNELSVENERTQKLFPYRDNVNGGIYGQLKKAYKVDFEEPIPFQHKLTEKEMEDNKYSVFFVLNTTTKSIMEVSKGTYKRINKSNSPYSKIYKLVELKLKLDNFSADANLAALVEGLDVIPELDEHITTLEYLSNPYISPSEGSYVPDITIPK